MNSVRRARLAACGALLLAACNSVTEQDEANARRRVELDTQQAAIVGDAADCGNVVAGLHGWYAANKNEVDRLDAWLKSRSEGQVKKLMAPYEEEEASLKARLTGTIKCGFVPWNGRRTADPR